MATVSTSVVLEYCLANATTVKVQRYQFLHIQGGNGLTRGIRRLEGILYHWGCWVRRCALLEVSEGWKETCATQGIGLGDMPCLRYQKAKLCCSSGNTMHWLLEHPSWGSLSSLCRMLQNPSWASPSSHCRMLHHVLVASLSSPCRMLQHPSWASLSSHCSMLHNISIASLSSHCRMLRLLHDHLPSSHCRMLHRFSIASLGNNCRMLQHPSAATAECYGSFMTVPPSGHCRMLHHVSIASLSNHCRMLQHPSAVTAECYIIPQQPLLNVMAPSWLSPPAVTAECYIMSQ